MNPHVRLAIFRRNFSSYFANPTGYVFICVFVLLSSIAAFWPNEFFTANLANLDQLNKYFPLIMLVFIPAITMSIWADERRQGTDELLLTIPATDFDVVLGKYLAAVAIYAVSLMFSLICNFAVLMFLGEPDLGLLACTYLGYLLVGMAMLSIGMVASFLTSNITVGFVLGAAFNALFVALDYADLILPTEWGLSVKEYGIGARLRDFTQGVLSLSNVVYLSAVVVVMLYLSMVLIGRRHWAGGRDGVSLAPHYLIRTLGLVAAVVGIFWLLQTVPARSDLSSEGLSSLDPASKKIVRALDPKRPIHIEAFISPSVPEKAYYGGLEVNFVLIRLDLLTRLHELAAYGGKNVTLRINDTEPFSEQSDRAEKLYGIKSQTVASVVRGQNSSDSLFLGVVLTSGLDKIVIPFVGPETPIEYELVRSLATLNGTAKKRLGVMAGGSTKFQEFDPQRMGRMKEAQIVTELKKQYDVVDVDPGKPVPDDLDVLLAIQPSAWQPADVDYLIAAVRRGLPTAICEDPQPEQFPNLVDPQQQQMPFMQETDVKKLWDLLGVEMQTQQIVYHDYNPMKRALDLPPEIVFISNAALGDESGQSLFDESDPISSKTQNLVFMFAGSVKKKDNAKLKFTPLARTSKVSGYVDKFDMFSSDPFMGRDLNVRRRRHPTATEYVMAARIQGPAPPLTAADAKTLADEQPDGTKPATAAAAAKNEAPAPASATPTGSATPSPTADASGTKKEATTTDEIKAVNQMNADKAELDELMKKLNPEPKATASGTATSPTKPAQDMDVVVFTDVDVLSSIFYRLRSQRQSMLDQVPNIDNVTFILNTLDVLADDERFVNIRKRRPKFRTLTRLDAINQAATDRLNKNRDQYAENMKAELEKEQTRLDDELAKLRADTKLKQIDKESRLEIFEKDMQRRITAKEQQLNLRREKQQKEEMRDLNDEIRRQQSFYKWCAVVLPPIPPLIIGLVVFFNRRSREQEGVSKSRLK